MKNSFNLAFFTACSSIKEEETLKEDACASAVLQYLVLAKQLIPHTNWTTSVGDIIGHVVGFACDFFLKETENMSCSLPGS